MAYRTAADRDGPDTRPWNPVLCISAEEPYSSAAISEGALAGQIADLYALATGVNSDTHALELRHFSRRHAYMTSIFTPMRTIFAGASSITSLSLFDMGLEEHELSVLCQAVQQSTVLTSLEFIGCDSVGSAFALVANMLSKSVCLRRLELDDVDLVDSSMEKLASAMSKNTTLTELQLDFNPDITFRGMENFYDMLASNVVLRSLDLGGTACFDPDLRGFPDEIQRKTLPDAIARNTALQTLIMRNVGIPPAAHIFLTKAFSRNCTLQTVSLPEPVPREVSDSWRKLRAAAISHYRSPRIRWLVRTRSLCQAERARAAFPQHGIEAWLCVRAPLWVVVHVSALLRA